MGTGTPPAGTLSRRGFLAAAAASAAGTALAEDRGQQNKGAVEVPWLEEIQRPPTQAAPHDPPLSDLLRQSNGTRISTVQQWSERRRSIRQWWLDFLGPLDVPREEPPQLQILEQERLPGLIRRRIRYEIEPKVAVEAYWLQPDNITAACPAVVALHSTVNHSIRQPAGVEGRPEKAFGLKLAQRGCVVICPRNFLWPNNQRIAAQQETRRFQQQHPQSKGMARMLFDAQVAVDLLCQCDEVDRQRIGCVGHSLGAKEALYLAAFDERVKVTVSSEGGIGTRFSNWDAPWYLGPKIKREQFDREHHEVLALVAPRPFLLLGGDSADGDRSWPFIEAVLPVYRLYGRPARIGLFNHKQGHNVPPQAEQRIYQWLENYLL